MKKTLVPFALFALLLTGCGQETGSAAAPKVEAADTESKEARESEAKPTATPSRDSSESSKSKEAEKAEKSGEKSPRGNLVKQVGEVGELTEDGEPVATFVVNSIDVDAACTEEFASNLSDNGHLLVLDVSIVTEPAYAESMNPTFSFDAYYFKEIAPDGTISDTDLATRAARTCLKDAELLPSTFGPGEKMTGKVVMDVTNPSGTIVFEYGDSPAGWEWNYPGA